MKSIIVFLILLNFYYVISSENRSYCVMSDDIWGIVQNSKEIIGNDNMNTIASVLYKTKTVSLKETFSDNLNTSLKKSMGPVLDFRWESFPYSNNINNESFVSMRTEPNKTWNHVKCKDENCKNRTDIFNKVTTFEDTESIHGKVHNYSFIYFEVRDNLSFELMPDVTWNGCFFIHFFINMCKHCNISVNYNNSKKIQTFTTNVNVSSWKLHSYLVKNVTNSLKFSLTIDKDAEDKDAYWAIDEVVYYSNYPKIVRHIELIDLNNNEDHCTTVTNKNASEIINTANIEEYIENFYFNNYCNEYCDLSCIKTIINNTNELPYLAIFSISIIVFLLIGLIGFCVYFLYFKKSKTDSELYQLLELEPLTKKQALSKKEYAISENWKEAESFWKKQYDELKLKQLEFFEESKQTVGLRPENKKKNLEHGIIPLDDYRIRLSSIAPKPSDYINATAIDVTQTLNIEAQYILAQNPLPQSMEDLLLMIWSQSVKYIIFLSAMDEKCINYWENYCSSQFRISRIEDEDTFEYFIKRTLKIEYKNEARILEQFHYDSWPIKGKPFFSWTVLTFFEHIKSISVHLNNRILIHSSNIHINIGLVVFCDVVQRSQIKLFEVAEELIMFYPNLFSNYEEYCLSHIFIYTMKKYRQTGINIDNNFPIELKNFMKQKNIDKVWNMNEKTFKALKHLHKYQRFIGDTRKDRYKDLELYDHSHVKLKLNHYINATYVDGYRFLQQYITTQQPLENSVYDFWQMIIEQKIGTIVNLTSVDYQLETFFCQFVPDQINSKLNFQDISINFNKIRKTADHYEIINIEIVQGDLTRKAIVMNVNNWFKTSKCPEKIDVIIESYREIRGGQRAVICSDDGISACGLLICFGYLIEMMATEGRFDIVASVNAIRRSHDHFICKEQFLFLCEAAQQYYRLYFHSEIN